MESLLIALQLHTPAELQFYSNLAHWVEGALFLVVAGIAFAQALGHLRTGRALYLWPTLVLVAGLFLPFFAFAHHLDEQFVLALTVTVNDPQQRQHMVMAALLAVAGAAEVAYLRGQGKRLFLRFVFPAALGVIGVLFLTHPQHGTDEAVLRAATTHRYLGTVMVLAGAFRALEVVKRNKKWLAFPWILFLVIGAALLIGYREPEGTYRIEPAAREGAPEMNHGNRAQ